MSSVGEDFPTQQARVRALLEQYRVIGPNGAFGALMIRQVLARAEEAMASGDVVRIVHAYQELTECK